MKRLLICICIILCLLLTACGSDAQDTAADAAASAVNGEIRILETMEASGDGEHVITADGEELSYANTAVNKTGDASGDEADFYGDNAAVFATNGGTLQLSEMKINTAGEHANAVFSYGEGTTVNIADSVIETSGNCSGGLMTTGGGTMNAERDAFWNSAAAEQAGRYHYDLALLGAVGVNPDDRRLTTYQEEDGILKRAV